MQQKRMLESDETVSAVDEKVRLEYRQLEKAIDRRQGVIAGLAFVSLVLGSRLLLHNVTYQGNISYA